jgi:hypothetical protein
MVPVLAINVVSDDLAVIVDRGGNNASGSGIVERYEGIGPTGGTLR